MQGQGLLRLELGWILPGLARALQGLYRALQASVFRCLVCTSSIYNKMEGKRVVFVFPAILKNEKS